MLCCSCWDPVVNEDVKGSNYDHNAISADGSNSSGTLSEPILKRDGSPGVGRTTMRDMRSPSPTTMSDRDTGSIASSDIRNPTQGLAYRDDVSALGTISLYSCSEYERAVHNPFQSTGSESSVLPTWMNDDEADQCCGCDERFEKKSVWTGFISVTGNRNSPQDKTRKHHCRRCRNVFCGTCTSNKALIWLLRGLSDRSALPGKSASDGGHGPERVCNQCFAEIPEENHYLQVYRPVLLRGEMFTSTGGFLGLSNVFARLHLTADGFSIVQEVGKTAADFDGQLNAEGLNPRLNLSVIALGDIEKVEMAKLTRFCISLAEGGPITLNSDTASTAGIWVEALRAACARAKQGSLKTRVELARRQKKEAIRRFADAERRAETQNAKRAEVKAEADKLRQKYKR